MPTRAGPRIVLRGRRLELCELAWAWRWTRQVSRVRCRISRPGAAHVATGVADQRTPRTGVPPLSARTPRTNCLATTLIEEWAMEVMPLVPVAGGDQRLTEQQWQ